MRILAVAAGEIFGGVERHLIGTAQIRGADVSFALFHDAGLATSLRDEGCEPHILPLSHAYDPRAPQRLAEIIRDIAPDVIHVHGYRAMVTVDLIRPRLSIPIIKTEHGLPEPPSGARFEQFKTRLNTWLDNRATRSASAVCYVTDDIRRRFKIAHAGVAQHTVHNGIAPMEPQAFHRPDDIPAAGPVFALVGRLSSVKGLDIALAALAHPAMPASATFLVIGTGPLEDSLIRESRQAGLEDRMRFLGFKTNVYDYLAHVDGLLMPSLHEGLPYTLLEAMSFGKPTLGSRVGGIEEVLSDGENGILYDVGDVGAVASACARIAEDPGLARRLGENAARMQRERYTLETMKNAYDKIYAEVSAHS